MSTTDPVVSKVQSPYFSVDALMKNNQLNRNEVLSILRTRSLVNQLKKELVTQASLYLDPTEAKRFIDAMDGALNNTKYTVGDRFIKLPKIKD